MRKIVFFCSILSLFPLVASKAGAQDSSGKQPATAALAQPVHYYRLDFVIENLDFGGKTNQQPLRFHHRGYGATYPHGDPSYVDPRRLQNSNCYRLITNEAGKPVSTEFQYVDLGVDLDIRDIHEVGRELVLDLTANLSSEASPTQPGQDPNHPVIRTNKWQSQVLIPIGKRTVVFASDSLDSKGSTRVEVTATPIEV